MSKYDTSYDRDPLGSLTPWAKDKQPEPGATVANAYADFDMSADISENAQIAWNVEEHERLKQQAAERAAIEAIPDSWTPAQIRVLAEAEEQKQQEAALEKEGFNIGQRFASEEPRYIPNAINSGKILNWIAERYGEVPGGADLPDLLHEAFNALVDAREITINATRPAPRKKYTAAELDAMPFDDLRELSNDNARITLEPEVPRHVINPDRNRV